MIGAQIAIIVRSPNRSARAGATLGPVALYDDGGLLRYARHDGRDVFSFKLANEEIPLPLTRKRGRSNPFTAPSCSGARS